VSVTTLAIGAGGRAHAVTIEPDGTPGRYRIAIDGEAPVIVDAAALSANGAATWSVRDLATGVVKTVAVTLGPGGEGEAVVGGHTVPVAIAGPRRGRRGALGSAAGDQRLLAPMPGKVIKVLVKPGDTVEPRQGLIVIEAMKMENELTAKRAGIITELSVSEGESVEAGRLLVVIG
jgi:biotin carboxyl carrier protein